LHESPTAAADQAARCVAARLSRHQRRHRHSRHQAGSYGRHRGAVGAERPTHRDIVEKPGFRLCDILVKTRRAQARALGTSPENYLRTLAYRLRQPARGLKIVKTGPVKEVVKLHNEADWTELPIPFHKDKDASPYITAMNIIRDPETGFYNSCHA